MKFNCKIDPEFQEYLEEQYKDYIKVTPMTKKEQRHLREWVKKGHSVRQSPGSKYLCDQHPPLDFLDNYRQDQEIEQAIKGMTDAEAEKYLKEYMGYKDEDPHEDTPQKTPEEQIQDLEHELSDGTLWEGQIALYFRWTCLPDCAVLELDADYRRNNRRLS